MIKLFLILLLLSIPHLCYANYELRLRDGVTLTWSDYTVEGDQYCTQKEIGRLCIQKRDVVSLKALDGSAPDAPRTATVNVAPPRRPAGKRIIDGIPVAGTDDPFAESFDEVMVGTMKRIGCSAAALAIADRGNLVLSRGYGWMDREKKKPAQPDTMIGIASCEKPVTAAAIKQLGREGKLDLDARLFAYLKITPRGKVADDRVYKITLRNVLEHKAGWGAEPASAAAATLRKAGAADPLPIEALLSVIMTQPLKNEPGTVAEYCNFGYDTLRYVLEKASGRKPAEYFRDVLFAPDREAGFYGAGAPLLRNAPTLVSNADAGGPISASAPALLRFMRRYWLTGEQRDSGNPLWVMYGSLDGSTSIMVWRPDGIDVVALFNGRGAVTHDEISRALQAAVDRLEQRRTNGR